MERTSYSQKYQFLFHEIPYSYFQPEQVEQLEAHLQAQVAHAHCEVLLELDYELMNLMWFHIDTHLTSKQRAMAHMLQLAIQRGEGQVWMSKQLGINQSSVVKSLQGGLHYIGGVVKRYGGIAHKLTRLLRQDPNVHVIMQQMEQLYDPMYQVRLPHFFTFRRLFGDAIQYQHYLQTGDYVSHGVKA